MSVAYSMDRLLAKRETCDAMDESLDGPLTVGPAAQVRADVSRWWLRCSTGEGTGTDCAAPYAGKRRGVHTRAGLRSGACLPSYRLLAARRGS